MISVLMPVYNAWPYLCEATNAILTQTERRFEFVIVNDGSTDNSAAYLEQIARQDERIRLIQHERTDLADVRNELVKLAQGEYLVWADADDVSMPDRVAKQVNYLNSHPECACVGSWALAIGPASHPFRRLKTPTSHDEIDAQHMRGHGGAILNPTACMRRSVVLQVGGFRQQFPPSEDYDLLLRLAEVGQLANLPEFLVQYRFHRGNATFQRQQEMARHAWDALLEACTRRGVRPCSPPEPRIAAERVAPELTWARWANAEGFHASARHFAWQSVCAAPRDYDSWKEFAIGLFPPSSQDDWWHRWVIRPSCAISRRVMLTGLRVATRARAAPKS